MNAVDVTNLLISTGPWGLVVVVGWAFWLTQNRKELEVKALYERIVELCSKQIEATIRMETALDGLTETLKTSLLSTHKK